VQRRTEKRFGAEKGLCFEKNGYLSPGTHECSLCELRRLVCANPYRRSLWPRLVAFLSWVVLKGHFSHVYIGGGFVSRKASPQDIDLVLETIAPYGPESFAALSPYFAIGLEKILRLYSIHLQFWIAGSPEGVADYRTFFQYGRPSRQLELVPEQRGIVKIDLRHVNIIAHLHAALNPDHGACRQMAESEPASFVQATEPQAPKQRKCA
jgi:hypothetical protein